MPREGGASSNDGLAIAGSPASRAMTAEDKIGAERFGETNPSAWTAL
jgi:hypothetical protein